MDTESDNNETHIPGTWSHIGLNEAEPIAPPEEVYAQLQIKLEAAQKKSKEHMKVCRRQVCPAAASFPSSTLKMVFAILQDLLNPKGERPSVNDPIKARVTSNSQRVQYALHRASRHSRIMATLLYQRAENRCRLKTLMKMATVVKRATGNAFMRHLKKLMAAYRKRCRDVVEDCTPNEEGGAPVDGVRIKDVSYAMRVQQLRSPARAYLSPLPSTQLRAWLNLHLQFGEHADAAYRCFEKNKGMVRLRLFIDGRRDVGKSNVVLATVKIEGHVGSDVEITIAIVETKEDRGTVPSYPLLHAVSIAMAHHRSHQFCVHATIENVLHQFSGLVKQFFALEQHGLDVYGVNVPVHCVTVLDGKMYSLAFGKIQQAISVTTGRNNAHHFWFAFFAFVGTDIYSSSKSSAKPCPLCQVTKGKYIFHSPEEIEGMRRVNDPATSLIQEGTFPLQSRCLVDPLHLGM